jgi:hypothetical protein
MQGAATREQRKLQLVLTAIAPELRARLQGSTLDAI